MFIDIQLAHHDVPKKGDSRQQPQGKALSMTKCLAQSKSSLDPEGGNVGRRPRDGSRGPAPLRDTGNPSPCLTQSFHLKKWSDSCFTRLRGKKYKIMGMEASPAQFGGVGRAAIFGVTATTSEQQFPSLAYTTAIHTAPQTGREGRSWPRSAGNMYFPGTTPNSLPWR